MYTPSISFAKFHRLCTFHPKAQLHPIQTPILDNVHPLIPQAKPLMTQPPQPSLVKVMFLK
jgi:hypothetical protein